MLFALPLDTENSVSRFLVVISLWFWMKSSAHWNSTWVTAIVGRPEGHKSLNLAWPLSESAISETQWLFSTALTLYTFLTTCEYLSLIPSLPQEIQSQPDNSHHHTMPFWRPTVHARENILFCYAAVASRSFKMNHRKNCADISCWFWLKYRQCCKLFGQPFY